MKSAASKARAYVKPAQHPVDTGVTFDEVAHIINVQASNGPPQGGAGIGLPQGGQAPPPTQTQTAANATGQKKKSGSFRDAAKFAALAAAAGTPHPGVASAVASIQPHPAASQYVPQPSKPVPKIIIRPCRSPASGVAGSSLIRARNFHTHVSKRLSLCQLVGDPNTL